MKSKNFKLLLVFLFVSATNVFAQDNKLYDLIRKTIDVNDSFFTDKYYDKGYVFSVNMGVNSKGVIDTVIFSHYRDNDELGQLINFNKIRNDLTNNNIRLKEYKNKILVLMVMIIRGDNAMIAITNGNQLLDNWKNIINCSAELPREKLVHLIPVLINSVGKNKIFN